MRCSRTALGQLIEVLSGRGGQAVPPLTVQPGVSCQNPAELAFLSFFFTAFAGLAAFEMLESVCSSTVAALLALPGAFVVLHVVPISVDLLIGSVRRMRSDSLRSKEAGPVEENSHQTEQSESAHLGREPFDATGNKTKRPLPAGWLSEEIHLWLATAYAALSALDWAQPLFRVWLALAVLNMLSFLVLTGRKMWKSAKQPHG
ncbi:MAG: hypothetical protein ACR2OZ_15500 [Verrucomicrobiales bacterium]